MAEDISWEGQCLNAADNFAEECRRLKSSNPHNEVALGFLINTLMTELWDRGFSQTEIRTAFEDALADMPRYTAGEERNGHV